MEERICIGFESARDYWRRVGRAVARDNAPLDGRPPLLVRILFDEGRGIDLASAPSRTRATSVPARVRAPRVADLLVPVPEFGPRVHVCVSRQAGRHVARGSVPHLMTGSYPIGSFRMAADVEGLMVPSPELAFLQMARVLDDDELVVYGHELCGYYARDNDGSGFVNCPACTSTSAIGSYLDRLERLRKERGEGLPPGMAQARPAVGRVLDGAASPEEAVVSMVLFGRRRMGGFGLPAGRLNEAVRLSSASARLFGLDSFVCDIGWPGRDTVFEYQGSQHKLRTRATYDLRKGNVLGADGRRVVQMNRAMLSRQDLVEEVAKSLALGLGVRWRPPDVALRTRQLRFRNKLLADLEGEA